MIQDANGGKSVYITRVRNLFDSLENCLELRVRMEAAGDGPNRDFSIRIPSPDTLNVEQDEFVLEYLSALIYNIISSFGGITLTFFRPPGNSGLDDLVNRLSRQFHPDTAKSDREGYGRCLNVAERMADALEGLKPGTLKFRFRTSDLGDPAESADSTQETPPKGPSVTTILKGIPEKLAGKTILGMDIGGSDIKVVLSVDGRIVSYKEYDWFPARFRLSKQLVDPVLMMARWGRCRAAAEADSKDSGWKENLDALSDADARDDQLEAVIAEAEEYFVGQLPGLDGIGLCFPDVVVRNKIVGGEVYKTRGIRNNPEINYEVDFRQLTDLDTELSRFCRTPGSVRNINDGPMASFTAAVEMAFAGQSDVDSGVFAHTLGTELGTGWLGESGELPEIPLEVYNYVIDLGSRPERQFHSDDPRSLNNFNTNIPGTLQKSISQSGVFRLALKYFPGSRPDLYKELFDKGFLENETDGSISIRQEPRDMRKALLEHLMALPEREGADGICGEIFREIGEYLAVTFEETNWILSPGTQSRVLFGRLVKNPVCFGLMQEGAARIVSGMRLIVADDESAWTPMMRQLRDDGHYTVAQFAQAVGAVYYAVTE